MKHLSYNASKAALNMLTAQLGFEFRDTRIKVNSADPGFTATDLNQHHGYQTVEQGLARQFASRCFQRMDRLKGSSPAPAAIVGKGTQIHDRDACLQRELVGYSSARTRVKASAALFRMDSILKSCLIRYVPIHQRLTAWLALYKIRTASRKTVGKLFNQKVWLPGMGSNHELDKILKSSNLLIPKKSLKSSRHQTQADGYKIGTILSG